MAPRRVQQQQPEETEVERVARLVVVNESAGHICFDLATNPGWTPDYIDEELGIPYYDEDAEEIAEEPQVRIAEEALALRVEQVVAPRMTLQEWIEAQVQRLGGEGRAGLPRLAAALLGIAYTRQDIESVNNARDASGRKRNAYRNELRKLEEYRQGKYKNASGERRERIANLKGGEIGNPYAESNVIFQAVMRRARPVSIGVTGEWKFSSTYMVRKYDTQPGETASAKTVLLNQGDNHVETVIASVNEGRTYGDRDYFPYSGTQLLRIFALHAEVVFS